MSTLLAKPASLPLPESPTRPVAPSVLAVRARNLSKSIDDRTILHPLDLDIPRGQFIALLGANGAGKSTLLKIIATLLPPTTGELALFNLPARSAPAKVRATIGLIGHQSMLYADLSPLENLTFFGKLYNLPSPRERARRLLSLLGLADRAHDPVKSFSRGMSQRVSIARALMHNPDLLLADEPFAGLDAPSAALLERLLTSLHHAGKTIILANHDIPQSLRLAQRVLLLAGGEKRLDAPADELDPAAILSQMQQDREDAA